jgi:hypothetical protein
MQTRIILSFAVLALFVVLAHANVYGQNGCDSEGYDRSGYNSQGYNRNGYTSSGYD